MIHILKDMPNEHSLPISVKYFLIKTEVHKKNIQG